MADKVDEKQICQDIDSYCTKIQGEQLQIEKAYSFVEKIGEGAYSKVYKALNKSGEYFAVKKYEEDDDQPEKEFKLLSTINHPKIVKCHDYYFKNERHHMVLEHLHTNLHNCKKKPEIKIIKSWLRQILDALCYCHDILKIVHCDLKPPNILVKKDGTTIKLADFGLYETIGEKPEYLYICTLWYKPPEQILGTKNCHPCIDMWAVGCIFAEIILGGPLFPGDSDIDQLFKIFRLFGTPDATTCPTLLTLPDWSRNFPQWTQTQDKFVNMFKTHLENDGIDLLSRMLNMEPTSRISAREALQHKWLKE